MKRGCRSLVAFVGLLLAGCHGGYDSTLMARLSESEKKVVGNWRLEHVYPSGESDELKKLMQLIEEGGGPISMECRPDKTFVMSAFDVAIEGAWSLQGTTVFLRLDKIGGKTPSEIRKIADKTSGVSGWNMDPSQRTEFLHNVTNAAAFEMAQSLSNLRIGVDGKSLYAKQAGDPNPFDSSVSVFRHVEQ